MALDLKLSVQTTDDCKNLVIEDVTGLYNETSNPGGWGGFNINGDRSVYNLSLNLVVYNFIEGEQYTTPISIDNFANDVIYPTEDTFRSFKISIPSYDISTAVANSNTISIPDSYNSMQEVVEDCLYEVIVTITSSSTNYSSNSSLTYKNICNSKKIVDRMISKINLGCEDCNDFDIDKALLAKSLLETIKNID